MSDERRLPVYLVLDCSGSMAGEPIAAMQMGLRALVSELNNDPFAAETVWLSVITFGSTAEQLVPLSDIITFEVPDLEAGGTTSMGEALDLLGERFTAEVRSNTSTVKGDWRPMVFLFTDGAPTDEWQEPLARFHGEQRATLIACGAGPEVRDDVLRQLSETVVRLDNTQPGTLSGFMKWVTASVTAASKSLGLGQGEIPPLDFSLDFNTSDSNESSVGDNSR